MVCTFWTLCEIRSENFLHFTVLRKLICMGFVELCALPLPCGIVMVGKHGMIFSVHVLAIYKLSKLLAL